MSWALQDAYPTTLSLLLSPIANRVGKYRGSTFILCQNVMVLVLRDGFCHASNMVTSFSCIT